jgi:hypothetical protein
MLVWMPIAALVEAAMIPLHPGRRGDLSDGLVFDAVRV